MAFTISNQRYCIRSECCDCDCWAINSRKANTNSEMSSLSYSYVPLAEKTEGPLVFALSWCIIGKVGFVNWCNSTCDGGVKSLMSDASILSFDGSFWIGPRVSVEGMCGCGCCCIIFSLTPASFSFRVRICNSNCRLCCFKRSNSNWSWILEGFTDFFYTFGVVEETCSVRRAAPDGDTYTSISVGEIKPGNS